MDMNPLDRLAGEHAAHAIALAYLLAITPDAAARLQELVTRIDELSLFQPMSDAQRAALAAQLRSLVQQALAFQRP